jgi:hypothetical protein
MAVVVENSIAAIAPLTEDASPEGAGFLITSNHLLMAPGAVVETLLITVQRR